MKPSKQIKLCLLLTVGWSLFPGETLFFVSADEEPGVEIQQLIERYYDLYNKLDLVSADQIVDHRLKHINENGVIQQFLTRDEVVNGTRRFQHQLKYDMDYYLKQTPSGIQIHSAADVVIATFYLQREKRQKTDDSLIELNHFRVTWVLQKKNEAWVVLHEQLSNHLQK